MEAKNTAYEFRATGQVINFDGYLKIYPEKSKELELPKVRKGENLDLKNLNKEQHFTKPPARYSDAGLVKVLEQYGIGRPSTYAPTIATIEARNYINRDDNKKLAPTDIAFVVNDLLVKHFPRIIDFQFTINGIKTILNSRKCYEELTGDISIRQARSYKLQHLYLSSGGRLSHETESFGSPRRGTTFSFRPLRLAWRV